MLQITFTIKYNWAFISRFNKNKSCTRARYAAFLSHSTTRAGVFLI